MRIILSIFLALCLYASTQSQTIQPDKQATKRKTKAPLQARNNDNAALSPLQQRAVYLIDQLSQKAKEIDDEMTRIRVRALVADLLWDYNQDRSRTLFEETFDATYTCLTESEKRNKTPRPDYGSPEHQLHNKVLRLISQRDPELAERLLKKVFDSELFQEINKHNPLSLQVAHNITETNPKKAGQILEASLKEGINPIVGVILDEIRHNDSALADKLFLRALAVAQSDSANIATNMGVLGGYVFPSYGIGELELIGRSRQPKEAGPAMKIRFLEFAYEMIIKRAAETQQNGVANNQSAQRQIALECWTLQGLLPYFNQYMPDKAGVVQAKINYLSRDIARERIDALTNRLGSDRTDNLIEKAKAAKSPAERDLLYTQAASYTNLRGEADKALSIASEIENEQRRSDVESIIRYQAALRALSKDDLDTAYRYAKDISFLEQYALMFNRMVRMLSGAKDKQRAEENKQRAMDLLNEAEKFLARAENGPAKALSMLTLAEAAIKADTDRAFDFMHSSIKAMNTADFSSPRSANKGGVEKSRIGLDTFNFDQTLAELAKSDPDRALWLAQSLERKELSVLAQLAVCRGMLSKIPEVDTATPKPAIDKRANKSPNQQGRRANNVIIPDTKKTP